MPYPAYKVLQIQYIAVPFVGLISVAHQAPTPRTLNELWFLCPETKTNLKTCWKKAATEPAHRPAFFRTLLESTVWVPGTAAQGEAVVEDSALDLQHWEKKTAPASFLFYLVRSTSTGG